MYDWAGDVVNVGGLMSPNVLIYWDPTGSYDCDAGALVDLAYDYGAKIVLFVSDYREIDGVSTAPIASLWMDIPLANSIYATMDGNNNGTFDNYPTNITIRKASISGDLSDFRFVSVRHWGEDPTGTWTLQVTDKVGGDDGTFNSWKMSIYGTSAGTYQNR